MKKNLQIVTIALITLVLFLSGCSNSNNSDVPTTNPKQNTTTSQDSVDHLDLQSYAGVWAEENIGWVNGGIAMSIEIEDNYALIDCTWTQAAPQSRMAEIYDAVDLTDTQENPVTLSFEDDGWGNAGTLILDFNKSEITCKIQDLHYTGTDGGAEWGFANGSYTLQKNNEAFDLLAHTMDDYYEMFPDEKSVNEEPSHSSDTSKASGILESLGMSEQQFKDSCALIYGLPSQDLVISIGQQYCYDTGCTTEEYIHQTYSESEIEEHLNTHHYFVGEKIVASADKELLGRMLNYSRDYIGLPYRIIQIGGSKGFDSTGVPYYIGKISGYAVKIYDLRDDAYYPIIADGDSFSCYGLFAGIESTGSTDYLVFQMLFCDKY